MSRIDASNGQLGGRSYAMTGFILGIIGTVLLVLTIAIVVIVIIMAARWSFHRLDVRELLQLDALVDRALRPRTAARGRVDEHRLVE